MCKWGTTKDLLVPIPAHLSHTGEFRWDTKPVDSCLADIVQALNDAGVYTAGCCCGHGQRPGSIILHDGRELIMPTIRHTPQQIEEAYDGAIILDGSGHEVTRQDFVGEGRESFFCAEITVNSYANNSEPRKYILDAEESLEDRKLAYDLIGSHVGRTRGAAWHLESAEQINV